LRVTSRGLGDVYKRQGLFVLFIRDFSTAFADALWSL
jgi:hypothetical protein